MAISIDWATKVISVPKADMTQISASLYELDLDTFRSTLKDLEDDEEGMPFPDTHEHTAPVTVGGVTLARVVEIINGYTITFENGQYAVNAVNANSNIADVINLNQVSLRTSNSAGLAVPESYFTNDDRDEALLTRKLLYNPQELLPDGRLVTYDDDGETIIDTAYVYDKDGEPIKMDKGVPAKRLKS